MADCHLANYNGERITDEGFTVASYKQETGMNLPRLYFLTKKAKHGKYQYLFSGEDDRKGRRYSA